MIFLSAIFDVKGVKTNLKVGVAEHISEIIKDSVFFCVNWWN